MKNKKYPTVCEQSDTDFKLCICIENIRAITKYNGGMTGRGGRIYLDPKIKQFESRVREEALGQCVLSSPLSGKLNVDIDVCFDDNKQPDLFNLPKAICDALNSKVVKGKMIRPGIWLDDRQIVSGRLTKQNDGTNRIFITITGNH